MDLRLSKSYGLVHFQTSTGYHTYPDLQSASAFPVPQRQGIAVRQQLIEPLAFNLAGELRYIETQRVGIDRKPISIIGFSQA